MTRYYCDYCGEELVGKDNWYICSNCGLPHSIERIKEKESLEEKLPIELLLEAYKSGDYDASSKIITEILSQTEFKRAYRIRSIIGLKVISKQYVNIDMIDNICKDYYRGLTNNDPDLVDFLSSLYEFSSSSDYGIIDIAIVLNINYILRGMLDRKYISSNDYISILKKLYSKYLSKLDYLEDSIRRQKVALLVSDIQIYLVNLDDKIKSELTNSINDLIKYDEYKIKLRSLPNVVVESKSVQYYEEVKKEENSKKNIVNVVDNSPKTTVSSAAINEEYRKNCMALVNLYDKTFDCTYEIKEEELERGILDHLYKKCVALAKFNKGVAREQNLQVNRLRLLLKDVRTKLSTKNYSIVNYINQREVIKATITKCKNRGAK